ncbi:uncharacterized protein LOC127102756 [Lathyrus oleraceus]|uniref:uncharacterized protein LOC127102756 n=1 Tax=Pisum sativum TaxID=3888 RepID=UPI0021D29514|nr:uncharacterized protein LOC127102756 [Pisum sativum]
METQITRIEDFLGAPRAQIRYKPPPSPRPETPVRPEEMWDETIEQEYQEVKQIPRVARRPPMVLVTRNQDPDHVVRQIRQEAAIGEQNLEAIVEQIIGLKVPKFTKFNGDTEESTVEHVARYHTEAGDIENNEDLKLKYFPSSLTKKAFTWFRMLPPQSVQTWTQLKRLFHEQFYMGQSKISLKELANVKRKTVESVD